MKLTKERIEELFNYNPSTGEFTRKISVGKGKRYPVGEVVGHIRKDGYVLIRVDGVLYYAHHMVYQLDGGIPQGYEVDHVDGNPSNNRKENLRLVTSSQNKYNTKKPITNKSGVKGVHWNAPTQSYRVRIRVDKKHIHIGMYNSLEAAEEAADLARYTYHREYAKD